VVGRRPRRPLLADNDVVESSSAAVVEWSRSVPRGRGGSRRITAAPGPPSDGAAHRPRQAAPQAHTLQGRQPPDGRLSKWPALQSRHSTHSV